MAVQDNPDWKALYARNVELHAKINSLEARLKLTEAVCEAVGKVPVTGEDHEFRREWSEMMRCYQEWLAGTED